MVEITAFGSHSLTLDFVDHVRSEGEDFDYGWKERWIRDEGYQDCSGIHQTLLESPKVASCEIANLILPCPFAELGRTLVRQ